jgi:hypothetical protein
MSTTAQVKVIGRCPECLHESLFLGGGGHVTCSNAECRRPDAASLALQTPRSSESGWPEEIDRVPETVDHPAHYGGADNPYEAIRVIEAWGLDADFCLGNAVKYLCRAGRKPDTTEVEDLRKARWYLDRAITQRAAQ